jgi:hypothetical protein
MKAKEKSKKYIEDYLKSSNEYPLVDNHQRAKLIKVDLYRMGKAHQDGYRQAINDVCDFLIHELVDNLYFGATHRTSTLNKSVLIDRIKKNAYE